MADFIKAFDSNNATPITDAVEFDPQNRDSGYYRTEYRLGAFNGSKGTHGNVGNMTIDIVEYGYWGKTNLCVYLSGTPNDVRTAYPALAKSVDPSLSDSDIQAVLDKSSSGGDVQGELSFAPSRQTVQSDYLIKHIDGSLEAFIDADLSKTKQ